MVRLEDNNNFTRKYAQYFSVESFPIDGAGRVVLAGKAMGVLRWFMILSSRLVIKGCDPLARIVMEEFLK
jgi:hypothetical protein